MKPIDRRSFLQLTGAAGAAGLIRVPGTPSGLRVAHAAEAAAAGSIIHGKSTEMIVHNAKLGVMETPLDALRAPHFTPKEMRERSEAPNRVSRGTDARRDASGGRCLRGLTPRCA